MGDVILYIEISEPRLFPFESLFQEPEAEIECISTKDLSSIGNHHCGLGASKIYTTIEIEMLVLIFQQLRKSDDGGDERDDILGKSPSDALNGRDIGERYENIDHSEFDVFPGKPDRISYLFPVHCDGNNGSSDELHLGFYDSCAFPYFPLYPVERHMFDLFDDVVDFVHSNGTLGILPDIVHMDDIRESKNRFQGNDDIARYLVEMFPCFIDGLFDGIGNPVQVGDLPIDNIFLALTHDSGTEDFELSSFDRTNKNLDLRGSYVEGDKLVVINNVAYLECHRE